MRNTNFLTFSTIISATLATASAAGGEPGERPTTDMSAKSDFAPLAADETSAGKRDKEIDQVIAALGPRANIKELNKYWDKYSKNHEPEQSFSDYVYDEYRVRKNIGTGLVALSSVSLGVGFGMLFYELTESAGDNACFYGPCEESDDYTAEQEQELADEKRRLEIVRKTGLGLGIGGAVLLPIGISLMVSGKRGVDQLSAHRSSPKTASKAPRLSIEPSISLQSASGSLLLTVSF